MTAPQSPADPTTTPPGGTARLAGRTVARIGFGVMQLHYATAGRDAALGLLREAVDLGVNHLDTAHFYGPCNELVRTALAPYPDDLVLAGKVGADDPGGKLVAAQRPEQLRAQVEANLSVLGVERLDVVNLRRADAPPGLIAEGDQKVDLDSQLAELSALRDAGKIGGIGLSNVSADQLRQALPAGIVCVQNDYSVLERATEPVLALCREHGIAWVPFFPLGSRFPGRPKVTGHPEVVAVAEELSCTPAQVALAWLLAVYDRTLLIAGTADPVHLRENIAAGSIRLSPQAVARLNRV
ncbi:aldo/keto reductase [Streptomyces sp. NPDC050534]|uniref:aldo/keto reductase n=1 Tax=Streptomyces sp. NPDC050534 TaxID=3365625 RepID=UPI0037A5E4D4